MIGVPQANRRFKVYGIPLTFFGVLMFGLLFHMPAHADHPAHTGDHAHAMHAAAMATDHAQTPWGVAGVAPKATRTIHVSMLDNMRFKPDSITVKQGETVRFVIDNDGKLAHEFVLGTQAVLDEHAKQMLKQPAHAHDAPYMATTLPGGESEVVWTFNRAGSFRYACLIPGHYQAGMVGTVTVTP